MTTPTFDDLAPPDSLFAPFYESATTPRNLALLAYRAGARHGWEQARQQVAFARAVLSRYGTAHPAPVPVGERPWEREGWCDKKGRCWINQDPEDSMGNPTWRLVAHGTDGWDFTRYPRSILLPHWALPLPGAK